MNLPVIALIMLVAGSAFARQDETPPKAQPVAYFDVLDLPARIDEPRLQKAEGNYVLNCALANRSEQPLVGLRMTLIFVDANGRISHLTWNEATTVPAYSIKSFAFNPPVKGDPKDAKVFLGIDEVIGRETVWRTVDADKLLRAYARGQHGMVPKVQTVQNKYDREVPRVISVLPPRPKP